MNKRKKIIFSITGISLILLVLLGLTYAYYMTQITGNESLTSITATTANLKLTYGDGNGTVAPEEPIMPGTTLTTKTFTVKNDGNKPLTYGVYLEEVVNELSVNDGLTYVLTCTSGCEGSEGTFPETSKLLVENTIEPNVTQEYSLTVTYEDLEDVDQTVDMGKVFSARVNIYSSDALTLNFTASTGVYAILESTPKKAYLISGKYTFVGVESGNHTLKIYDANNTLLSTKTFTIRKGDSTTLSGDTVDVELEGAEYNIELNGSGNIIGVEYIGISNPYASNKNLLAYNIINNAANNLNGTEYREIPITTPGENKSAVLYVDGELEPEKYNRVNGTKYFTYGDSYEFNQTTGRYTIVNKDGSALKSVQYSSGYNSTLIDKYVVSIYGLVSSKPQSGNNIYYIYKVTSSTTSDSIYYRTLKHSNKAISIEKELSVTSDDYTSITNVKSYYYRGGVEDNYVNFAGMCWRIVRIEGDGSVKIILEDSTYECNDTSFNGNWSIGNTVEFGYDSNNKADFLGYSGGLADTLKTYQTTLNSKIEAKYSEKNLSDYLKVDDWCYDDSVTETGKYSLCDEECEATETYSHYAAYTRLYKNHTPSLICTGQRLNNFIDGKEMYVGTLTADEIIYSGSILGDSFAKAYYLFNNYSINNKSNFFTLSPFFWTSEEGADHVSFVYDDGGLSYRSLPAKSYSRPSITLKSGTEITGGVGTQSNPYIIK